MLRKRTWAAIGLVGNLGVVAALAFAVGHPSTATVAANRSGEELEMPAIMQKAANFKAQPAPGRPVPISWSNLKVNTDSSGEAQNEPYIAVDPNNPQHLVVGANSWQSGNGNYEVYAYVSFNGGSTWTSSQPYVNRNASRLNAADPTIAFAKDGSVYFAFVASTPAAGAVAISRSTDGGLTWSSQNWATSFNGAADKPAIAFSSSDKLSLFYQNNGLVQRNFG